MALLCLSSPDQGAVSAVQETAIHRPGDSVMAQLAGHPPGPGVERMLEAGTLPV